MSTLPDSPHRQLHYQGERKQSPRPTMDTLRQRLKELDRDKFEELTFCLIKASHPDANIHHVDGSSGDQGVDTFAGDLQEGSTIWQALSSTIRRP